MDIEMSQGPVAGATTEAHKGLLVTYQNLSCSCPATGRGPNDQPSVLLHDATGCLQPSQVTALMGPPGSGAATLLRVLSGRRASGSITGAAWVGGMPPTTAFLQRCTGYVSQGNTLLHGLTVEEMLMYTAELKLPQGHSHSSKAAAVSSVLQELDLNGCRAVKIGGLMASQAKRTSIGMAMLPNPGVLFLEEPTADLDNISAYEMAALLRQLSRAGLTVVATLYAPSADVFAMFDKVVLLAQGYTVYAGPTVGVLRFVKEQWPLSAEQATSEPTMMVAMTWLADAAQSGMLSQLVRAYNQSPLRFQNDANLAAIAADSEHMADPTWSDKLKLTKSSSLPYQDDDASFHDNKAAVNTHKSLQLQPGGGGNPAQQAAWWWGVWVLFIYKARRHYTSPAWLLPRILDKLLYSLLGLTLYVGMGDDPAVRNAADIWSLMFLWTILPGLTSAIYVPALAVEKGVYLRERGEKMYYTGTYFAAKCLEEVPLLAILTIFMACFTFYGVELQGSLLLFWLVYFLNVCISMMIAFLVAAVVPGVDGGCPIVIFYMVTTLHFAGMVLKYGNIPPWWNWYSRIAFMRYGWTALMVNQFDGFAPSVPIRTITFETWDLEGKDKWANIGYLTIFLPAFTVLAYLALAYITPRSRS